jgi:hypothetical protein
MTGGAIGRTWTDVSAVFRALGVGGLVSVVVSGRGLARV